MSDTVAVDDLRVGMFIHLDLGWMAHPFPLSSFRIASVDEIVRIRSLGLKQLRWSPEKSLVEQPLPAGGADGAEPLAETADLSAAVPAAASDPEAAKRALSCYIALCYSSKRTVTHRNLSYVNFSTSLVHPPP